jgi:uncharacterized protein
MPTTAGDRDSDGTVHAEPIGPAQRIEAIDALRGLALLGVLIVNLVTEFRVSIFSQFIDQTPSGGPWDRLISDVVSFGLEMKAFSLFSLLFGVGLAIQFERLRERPDRATLLFRRMAALLLFGLIHLLLIWNGDILTEYAIAGFLVLPLLYAPSRVVAAVAAACGVFYAAMPFLHLPIPFPHRQWIVQHVADAAVTLGHGGLLQVIKFNIAEVPSLVPLHLFVFPRTVGLFALGICLWRARFFSENLGASSFALALVAVPLGAVLTVRASWLGAHIAPIADQLAPVILALGYAGIILWLASGERRRLLVMWAAPLGRMAFTNYVAQSVIFGWFFYGYGFGQFDRLGVFQAFELGVIVYLLQATASAIWLRHFRFGPLEWLWRALMYGRLQRMRKSSAPAARRPVAV